MRSFAEAWSKATSGLLKVGSKSLPKINATLDLSNTLEIEIEDGDADSFEGMRSKISEDVNQATEKIAGPLEAALNSAMAASWGWSSGVRDIIDTGELRNSLSIAVENGNVKISYDAPYAKLVHYGGYIMPYGNSNASQVYLPGRPWVTATLEGNGPVQRFDLNQYYEGYL